MLHCNRTLIVFCILFCLLLSTPIVGGAPPPIAAQSAILMDAKTGQILHEKKAQQRSAPASTTKIITAILAIESNRLDDMVTISPRAASTAGSSLHLYAGQVISLRELLTGLLMRSGNDAAVAIAEHLAGSVDAFVLMMNIKARDLGAVNSHFTNPHGLSAAGHYSTAYDLALITRYALGDPIFSAIVSTKETNIEWLDRRGREQDKSLRNTNKLLWMLEEADGVKTGTTGQAGPCLVSSATRGSQRLIAVVLHDHSRWYDSMKLLQYGFDAFDLYEFAASGDVLSILPVDNALETTVEVSASSAAALVVAASDYPKVTVEVDLPERVKAPLYRGQKVGEIIFFVDEKAVKIVDILCDQEVTVLTPANLFSQQMVYLFRHLARWGLI